MIIKHFEINKKSFDINNDWRNNADLIDNTIQPILNKIINHNDISRNQL